MWVAGGIFFILLGFLLFWVSALAHIPFLMKGVLIGYGAIFISGATGIMSERIYKRLLIKSQSVNRSLEK